ncbi:MAG TPA: hypothetical protein VIJ93_12750, partial [bacterium]
MKALSKTIFGKKATFAGTLALLLIGPSLSLAQSCPNGGSVTPPLNLEVVCGSETAQIQDFGAKIINWGATPITLSNLTMKVWIYETGADTFHQWNVNTGSLCDASNNCTEITLPNAGGTAAGYPLCTSIPGHFANQVVTFSPGTGATPVSLIPPNGGYFVTNSGAGVPGADLRFGRSNSQMDGSSVTVINGGVTYISSWADDYSHLGTGLVPIVGGSGCPDGGLHDSPYYALYYNGVLVQEVTDALETHDPFTGQEPCSLGVSCTYGPTGTPIPLIPNTPTITNTPSNTPTITPTPNATGTAQATATFQAKATATAQANATATSQANATSTAQTNATATQVAANATQTAQANMTATQVAANATATQVAAN